MQLSTIQDVAMVPVRGTVFIVKIPFVYLWKLVFFVYCCLYAAVVYVVSTPVYFGKKLCHKLYCTWEWAKISVKSSLGFTPRPAITDDRTPEDNPLLELDHIQNGRRRRLRSREKRVMIAQLLRMILEPGSSAESDDEPERPPAAARPLPEPEGLDIDFRLIQDLVRLSQSRHHPAGGQAPQGPAPALQQDDLEAILRNAQDRESLQAMINEMDQVNIELPSTQGASNDAQDVPALDGNPERPVSQNSSEAVYTPVPCSSSDENNEEEFHDVPETLPRPLYTTGALSPVQESPEYLSGSSESLKMNQLQEALDKLSTATQELDKLSTASRERDAEFVETEITQKTVTVTEGQADLECVPRTVPLLGVQVGHQKKDLAHARNTRPPTKKLFQGLTTHNKEDTDSSSDEETGETRPNPPRRRHSSGAPPQLTVPDQISLLTAGNQNWPKADSNDQGTVETGAVETGSRAERQGSDPPRFSRQNSNSSDTDKKVAIPNNKPPWMDMRNRSSSNSSDIDPSTVVIFKPPPSKKTRSLTELQPDTAKTENIWNTDPAHDNREGLYDTLAAVHQAPPPPLYLHERLALRTGTSSVEPSPKLPPRNGLVLKRASSDEVVSNSPPRHSSRTTTEKKSPTSKESSKERSRSREKESSRASSRDKSTRESRSKVKDERDRSRTKDEREKSRTKDERDRSRTKDERDRSRTKDERDKSRTKEERESRSRTKDARESRPKTREERESRSKIKDERESRSRDKDTHHSSSHHRSKSSDRASSHSTHRHSSDHHGHRSRSGDRSASRSTERHSSHRSSERHSSSAEKKTPSKSSSKSAKPDSKKKESSPLASLLSRITPSPKIAKDDKKKSSSRSDEKKSSKSEKRRVGSVTSSPDKESDSSSGRSVVRSSSSSSLRSVRSAGAASVYSFDSALSGRISDA